MLIYTAEQDAFPLTKSHDKQPSYDLKIKATLAIRPYENRLISTGIKIKIPTGEVGLVLGTSRVASEGLLIFPTLFFADCDKNISVRAINVSDELITLSRGYPLAQFLPIKLGDISFCDIQRINNNEYQDILKQTT